MCCYKATKEAVARYKCSGSKNAAERAQTSEVLGIVWLGLALLGFAWLCFALLGLALLGLALFSLTWLCFALLRSCFGIASLVHRNN